MDDNESFQKLKEKEITRLTTPMSYPKLGKFTLRVAPKDCEGNPIHLVRGFRGNRYILEPKPGMLTDDEILMYAPESKAACKIRLKRGTGNQSDIFTVYDILVFIYTLAMVIILMVGLISLMFDNLIVRIFFLLVLVITVGSYIYIVHIRDYSDSNHKNNLNDEKLVQLETLSNDDLFLLFENKEKIAREMVEKRFPAPQLTNSKFNGVLDNCRSSVKSQIEILNDIIPTEKTKYEIDSRKKLIKQVIGKIDDLTNELILSDESNLEEVIEDMDKLISSVKDYE